MFRPEGDCPLGSYTIEEKKKSDMYFVYILKSLISNKSYVGFTSKSVDQRLKEHNIGSNIWTRKYKPYKLVYYESYYCKKDVLHREYFFKSGVGNKLVKLIIDNY
jgi:putative endonuclease